MRNKKGITLIALVITIIVLLILATVSIQAILGENGIVNKAKKAQNQTEIGTEKEQINVAYTSCKLSNVNSVNDTVTAEELEDEMNNSYGLGLVEVTGTEYTLTVRYVKSNRNYLILQSGIIVDLEEVLSNATYGVAIGLAEDGSLVDMSNWNYTLITLEAKNYDSIENDVRGYVLGLESSGWNNGYKGEIVDGRIVGKMPAYILENPEGFGTGYYEDSFIPVISVAGALCYQEDLMYAPEIPNTVITLGCYVNGSGCFAGCTSLIEPPVIPNSVVEMLGAFQYCESLEKAPVIPDSVVSLENAFRGCIDLKKAPEIPNGVEDISYAFDGCENLLKAPIIPSSVIDMPCTFNGCSSLTGELIINSNPRSYWAFLDGASTNEGCELILTGLSTMLQELAETGSENSNIRVEN